MDSRPGTTRGSSGLSGRWLLALAAVALALGVAGGAVGAALVVSFQDPSVVPQQPTGVPSEVAQVSPTRSVVAEDSALIQAVERARPSTVTITNNLASRGTFGRSPGVVTGSGVIVDERGYVATNYHVVRDAEYLTVFLSSGHGVPAKLVGSDPLTDLALLKVDAPDLVPAALADSDELVLGQRVFSIGSPLGDFRGSISAGIISGLHRSWDRGGAPMENLIQTDAAINQGNSGGPLLDFGGNVIGINTSVIRITESGDPVEGMAFAIPSNAVRFVVDQLIEQGRVVRPYLGIAHTVVTPALAAARRLLVDQGVLVTDVVADSAAARAGLQKGDIVYAIGDVTLDASHPLASTLLRYRPGERVTLQVYRGERSLALEAELTERQ